ncbi:unnamed protein product [Victoria cruziana]
MMQPEANIPFLDDDRIGDDTLLSVHTALIESKKLWRSAGPAVFNRLATYGMNVVTLAFVGRLGDLELAIVSFASTIIVGLNVGLMVMSLVSQGVRNLDPPLLGRSNIHSVMNG